MNAKVCSDDSGIQRPDDLEEIVPRKSRVEPTGDEPPDTLEEDELVEPRVWPWFLAVVVWAVLALFTPMLLGALGLWHSPVNAALWLLRPEPWRSLITGWIRGVFGLSATVLPGWVYKAVWVASFAVILLEIIGFGWLISRADRLRLKRREGQASRRRG